MLTVRLKILPEENSIGDIALKEGIRISILRCSARAEGGGRGLLCIDTGKETDDKEVKRWFAGHPHLHVDSCHSVSGGRHLMMLNNDACRICRSLPGSGCFLDSGRITDNGAIIWKTFVPDRERLKSLIADLRSNGCKVELLSVKRTVYDAELTDKQRTLVRKAFMLGYYDVPKRITLDELASVCGVSKATLNVILRKAQHKILAEKLMVDQ